MTRNVVLAIVASVGLASSSAAWIFADWIAGVVIAVVTVFLTVGLSEEVKS